MYSSSRRPQNARVASGRAQRIRTVVLIRNENVALLCICYGSVRDVPPELQLLSPREARG